MRGLQVRGLDVVTGLDPQSISQSAQAMRTQATAAGEAGESLVGRWSGLSAVYQSPEAADLHRAVAPVAVATVGLSSGCAAVSSALETYAQDLVVLHERQRLLVADVHDLEREASVAEDWKAEPQLVSRRAALQGAADKLGTQLSEAESRCIAAIGVAQGDLEPVDGASTWELFRPEWGYAQPNAPWFVAIKPPPIVLPTARRASDVAYKQLCDWMVSSDAKTLNYVGAHSPGLFNGQLRNGIGVANGSMVDGIQAMFNAIGHEGGQATAAALLMRDNFRSGGPWDAKVQLREEFDVHDDETSYLDMGNGYEMYYDVFGNVQFGAMASRFGVDKYIAIDASNVGGTSGTADSADDASIELGYVLAERYPEGFTDDQFYSFLTSSESIAILTQANRIRKVS